MTWKPFLKPTIIVAVISGLALVIGDYLLKPNSAPTSDNHTTIQTQNSPQNQSTQVTVPVTVNPAPTTIQPRRPEEQLKPNKNVIPSSPPADLVSQQPSTPSRDTSVHIGGSVNAPIQTGDHNTAITNYGASRPAPHVNWDQPSLIPKPTDVRNPGNPPNGGSQMFQINISVDQDFAEPEFEITFSRQVEIYSAAILRGQPGHFTIESTHADTQTIEGGTIRIRLEAPLLSNKLLILRVKTADTDPLTIKALSAVTPAIPQ